MCRFRFLRRNALQYKGWGCRSVPPVYATGFNCRTCVLEVHGGGTALPTGIWLDRPSGSNSGLCAGARRTGMYPVARRRRLPASWRCAAVPAHVNAAAAVPFSARPSSHAPMAMRPWTRGSNSRGSINKSALPIREPPGLAQGPHPAADGYPARSSQLPDADGERP